MLALRIDEVAHFGLGGQMNHYIGLVNRRQWHQLAITSPITCRPCTNSRLER